MVLLQTLRDVMNQSSDPGHDKIIIPIILLAFLVTLSFFLVYIHSGQKQLEKKIEENDKKTLSLIKKLQETIANIEEVKK